MVLRQNHRKKDLLCRVDIKVSLGSTHLEIVVSFSNTAHIYGDSVKLIVHIWDTINEHINYGVIEFFNQ